MTRKTIFCICLMFSSLTSCVDPTVQAERIDKNLYIREFTYKGHAYLEIDDITSYSVTFLHDPNCKCKNMDYKL